MMSKGNRSGDTAELRNRAEEITPEKTTLSLENLKAMSLEEIRQSLYELRVHQIELEMQNDELRKSHEELDASRTRYFNFYDMAPVGYCTISEKGLILEVNFTCATLLGVVRSALIKLPFSRFIQNEDQDSYYLLLKQVLNSGEPQTCELRMMKIGGAVFWAHLVIVSERNSEETPLYRIVLSDITERKIQEKKLQKLNRTLMAITHSSEAMMRATDETAYLGEICNIIVKDCGYTMVWFGYAENDAARSVRPVVSCGFDAGYLESLKITWADTEHGQGPTGTAIRTGRVSTCGNMKTNPNFTPWCEEAFKRGYASSLALPLIADGRCLGAISIYSGEPDSFTEEEIELLMELTKDLAFGIMSLRLRIERTRANEALRESEKRYLSLFNGMTEGFALHEIITDGTGQPCDYRFLDLNPAFERLTGLKRKDVIGKTLNEVLPKNDPMWVQMYGAVALTGVPVRFDNYSQDLQRHYEVLAYRPARGQFAVIFMDITKRKQAEDALRESEARLRIALEAADLGTWDIDPATGIAIRSLRHDQIFGYQELQTEWTIEIIERHILPEDLPLFQKAHAHAMQTGKMSLEARVRWPDGSIHWISSLGSAYYDSDGRPVRFIGVIADTTERKQSEERIRASLAEKEVLLKEIHHRVKNNLQVISSLISLQADSLANKQLQGILGDVRDRVRTMAMVHEKLYQTDNLAQLDFAEYALGLLNYLWSAHGDATSNLRLNMSLVPLNLPVEMAVTCGLILNELASNAIKHAFPSGSDGEVIVTLEHDPDTGAVCLRVSDNGVGLPADLDWRNSSSLGLRLVQMLAGQMRGTVQTSPGPGTEFQIRFNVKGISS